MKNNKHARPWRDEKVVIVFRPRFSQLRPLADRALGDWVVLPPNKVVSPGQTVTWKTVPGADLELFLPDVFTPTHVAGRDTLSAKVSDDAAPAFHFYEAYCNGQLATGGSSPGVIIDP